MEGRRMGIRTAVAAGVLVLLASAAAFSFQDAVRGIKPDEFIKARPVRPGHKSAQRPIYKPVEGAANIAAKASDLRQIGMTIWRLRPSRKTDSGARILVQEAATEIEWTPERISTRTPLKVGDQLRFSFESAQNGYLYVIDREKYADGKLGEPTLIFPTTRLRNGENAVTPGRLIEIPDQSDRPNYFTLRRSRPDQAGEELVLLLTPQPLQEISVTDKAQVLPEEELNKWEKQWRRPAQELELAGGAGRTWTRAEQQAGSDQTRLLTQDDPSPQTVYRVASGPDDPIVLHVNLRYNSGRNRGTTKAFKKGSGPSITPLRSDR